MIRSSMLILALVMNPTSLVLAQESMGDRATACLPLGHFSVSSSSVDIYVIGKVASISLRKERATEFVQKSNDVALGKSAAFCERVEEVNFTGATGVFQYDVCYTGSEIELRPLKIASVSICTSNLARALVGSE